MSSSWIKLSIAILIGTLLGVIYGWMIDPIEYTDVTPGILREDYRADYVLMIAEAYHNEYDSQTAARRLAILGSETPAEIVKQALEYARAREFSQNETAMLQELLSAMQTYQPQGINAP